MVFEAYYDYERVDRWPTGCCARPLPLVLIPLLILQLVQIPIASRWRGGSSGTRRTGPGCWNGP